MSGAPKRIVLMLGGLAVGAVGAASFLLLLWASLWAGFANFNLLAASNEVELRGGLASWFWLIISLFLLAIAFWCVRKASKND